MVYEECYLSPEEAEITITLIAIICSYGNGLPLEYADDEFTRFNGYHIPYKEYGYPNLRSYINTLPEIYIINKNGKEVLIQNSQKSAHIQELIEKQKPNHKIKRKIITEIEQNNEEYKRRRCNSLSITSSGFHETNSFIGRCDKYTQLVRKSCKFNKTNLNTDFFN